MRNFPTSSVNISCPHGSSVIPCVHGYRLISRPHGYTVIQMNCVFQFCYKVPDFTATFLCMYSSGSSGMQPVRCSEAGYFVSKYHICGKKPVRL